MKASSIKKTSYEFPLEMGHPPQAWICPMAKVMGMFLKSIKIIV